MEKKNRPVDFAARVARFTERMSPFISAEITDYLSEHGFFTAPASTIYHGSYEGGLFDHSYEVAQTLWELTKANGLMWQRAESPLIVGMFHDLCKMDAFIEEPAQGAGARSYGYNEETLLKGHGEKSVMRLACLMQLTEEEVACIRYHMGAFTDAAEWKDYTRAVHVYPNVLWTHHADMIACHVKGI
ncbi:MAG: hypothetical protein Q4A66_08750 [Eubacteriales bacterium]|nr:hypothetical protein [Eubacteriales bacterium]